MTSRYDRGVADEPETPEQDDEDDTASSEDPPSDPPPEFLDI